MTKADTGVRRYFAGKMAFMEIPKAGHMAIGPTLPRTILQRLNTAHSAWQQRLQAWQPQAPYPSTGWATTQTMRPTPLVDVPPWPPCC